MFREIEAKKEAQIKMLKHTVSECGRFASTGTLALLRWPPGTSADHAPAAVQRALGLPGTLVQTLYALRPGGIALCPTRVATVWARNRDDVHRLY